MKNDEDQYFEPVNERDNVKEAFDHTCAVFTSSQFQERVVVTPAGHTRLTLYWHNFESFSAWCGFRDPDVKPRRKYWNCFGIDDCSVGNAALSPDLEINPPPAGGMNLNYGGVFLTTRSGEDVYLGHTGRITIHHRRKSKPGNNS